MKALLLLLSLTGPAMAQDVAIGDSIALGTGRALGVPSYARQNMSSCWILRHMPPGRFEHAVISAGINDAPGPCVGAILGRVRAGQVVVILPAAINSARAHVAASAQAHGFQTVSYACRGGCNRHNFHPASYDAVTRVIEGMWYGRELH